MFETVMFCCICHRGTRPGQELFDVAFVLFAHAVLEDLILVGPVIVDNPVECREKLVVGPEGRCGHLNRHLIENPLTCFARLSEADLSGQRKASTTREGKLLLDIVQLAGHLGQLVPNAKRGVRLMSSSSLCSMRPSCSRILAQIEQ